MRTSITFFILLFSLTAFSQKIKTDANIVGHVTSKGEHIPFASVSLKGTTIGTSTDLTGHYHMVNVPIGKITIIASAIGYKTQEITIETQANKTVEVKFDLEEDILEIEGVVVSSSRNSEKRKDIPMTVNTISPKLLNTVQATTLSEGLNFAPGLRMENNCQNCGFNQVRMNGMEGAYSQILINSRPIFSGLAGVYGLELIPANMIERIEVVRGGGSALFGGNAIAGTINLITKDPISNTYEIGMSSSLHGVGVSNAGSPSADNNLSVNTSMVSEDHKMGISLYGNIRNRNPFDYNNDGFSELTKIQNTTLGARFYHRTGSRSKITFDFFNISELRRGGDKFDYQPHEANIAEELKHNITTSAISFDKFLREIDLLSAYLSVQQVYRDSYYGANQSLKDYGKTKDISFNTGIQYKANFSRQTLVAGTDVTGSKLNDKKLGYFDSQSGTHTNNIEIADQSSVTLGLFAQHEVNLGSFTLTSGLRLDRYNVKNEKDNNSKTGTVLIPRIGLMFTANDNLKLRGNFAQGYRAPQIFNEDLHIESSGLRAVTIVNAPNLKEERSNSITLSADYSKRIESVYFNILIEGFYTSLKDAFEIDHGTPDTENNVVNTRQNAKEGALVRGVNIEANVAIGKSITLSAGGTLQRSEYEKPQENFNTKRFYRTPNAYGFATVDWDFTPTWCISGTGNYTGSMKVPYYGLNQANPESGTLKSSKEFYDFGIKISKKIPINGTKVQVFVGAKNIFNSYQDDFDSGINRDPSFVYGPGLPRTIYFGIKLGNLL